jgi:HrpA-like RNA helicase
MLWESLDAQQLPEMLRSPLEHLCLQVKSIVKDRSVADILAEAIDPPASQVVDSALGLLEARQLLDAEERLTALGQHLTQISLDPAMGAPSLLSSVLDSSNAGERILCRYAVDCLRILQKVFAAFDICLADICGT